MRSRVFVGALLLIGILAAGSLAASDVGKTPSRQWIITTLLQPTMIAGIVAQGPVMIVHDDGLMAKGEQCTAVYRFDTSQGPQEKLVSFMCTPTRRDVVNKFTITCSRTPMSDFAVLDEYQFAGDKEGHEVPRF